MAYDVNTFFPYIVKSIRWSPDLVFCILPKRCFYSGKRLWFKKVYVGTLWATADMQLLAFTIYADKNQFIIHALS